MAFRDRKEAGQRLARELLDYANRRDVLILALPRGGVPVAYEIACTLHDPLDVFLVRKLGAPGRQELAMGALATGGIRVLNDDVVQALEVPDELIDAVTAEEKQELERRERNYRGDRAPIEVRSRTVILVDDGLATGSSMRAAIKALRCQRPHRIVVAVPVGAAQTCGELRDLADELICLQRPDPFYSVGMWYGDFSQTTDEEVRELLQRAWESQAARKS